MAALLADMAQPDHPGRPVLVLSNRADAGGLAKAAAAGVATAVVDHRAYGADRGAFDAALAAAVAASGATTVCLAGFLRILGPRFLDQWPGQVLNIHPSLLPLFPGLHTHARALRAGVAVHGATVHLVTEALDQGPILGQGVVPVAAGDTPQALAARVLTIEHRLYPPVLRRHLSGRAGPFALFA